MKRTYLTVFSPLLQSFALEQCFHLFYIIFSWKFFEFRNWNAPKTLKRRAELVANCAFPYSVLATSSRNGQCLSESRWGSRCCDVICAQRQIRRLKLFLSLLGDGSYYSYYSFLLIDGLRNRAKVTLRASLARQPYCSYCIRDTLITYRGTHFFASQLETDQAPCPEISPVKFRAT